MAMGSPIVEMRSLLKALDLFSEGKADESYVLLMLDQAAEATMVSGLESKLQFLIIRYLSQISVTLDVVRLRRAAPGKG